MGLGREQASLTMMRVVAVIFRSSTLLYSAPKYY